MSGVDLSGVDLSGVDLSGVDLSGHSNLQICSLNLFKVERNRYVCLFYNTNSIYSLNNTILYGAKCLGKCKRINLLLCILRILKYK